MGTWPAKRAWSRDDGTWRLVGGQDPRCDGPGIVQLLRVAYRKKVQQSEAYRSSKHLRSEISELGSFDGSFLAVELVGRHESCLLYRCS